jgi:signal transduction histidine kinase
LEAGCDAFIRKPYRDMEIFDALATHLGVSFLYDEETEQKVDPGEVKRLDPAQLETLPDVLLTALRRAAILLDEDQALEVAGEISDLNHELGEILRHMLDTYQYEALLALLDSRLKSDAEDPEERSRSHADNEILIVEDNIASLRLLMELLSAKGFRTRPSMDGKTALRSVRARAPDLILLDIKMPGMDGLEVCRQLKADTKTRDIPVIFISGMTESKAIARTFEIGGIDYITKPFESVEILARINTHLNQARMQRELQHAAQALQNANQELEAFTYSVSHDLGSPVRGVKMSAQILLEDHGDLLDDEGKTFLHDLMDSADEMRALIDGLLVLSRSTRGTLDNEWIDLSAMAEEIVETLRKTEPERQVNCHIAPNLEVIGDPRLIKTALDNLLGNAWKYTGRQPNARIELSATIQEDETVFRITDNGAGFDMAYVNHLFKPFSRLHGVEAFPGTGIGLATVQRIVRRHGGRVWAEAEVDRGATFYFTIASR